MPPSAEAVAPAVVVTGASSGIGRAIARGLAEDGRTLILAGRDLARLEETKGTCHEPSRHRILATDLREPERAAAELVELLKREAIGVAGFVHSAGVVPVGPARTLPSEVVREAMNVNLLSAIEIVRVLLTKAHNRGPLTDVVLLSGLFSVRGAKGHTAYAATKGGLDAYMRSLALELAPRVRVNSVVPGAVKTPMSAKAFADPEFAARMEREYPLGVGEPSDVAGVVRFLFSPAARWITGQALVVDGGRSLL